MRTKLFLILGIFLLLQFSRVFADEMKSPNYRLELETVEEKASEGEEIIKNEPRAIREDLYNTFQQNGYVILNNEEDQKKEIVFNLSKTSISFDTSAANSKDDVAFSVSAPDMFGYQLHLIKKKSIMHTSTQDIIAQTECDSKQTPCSDKVAQPWKQEPIYGIGYNLQGQDIPTDFINEMYFRPFPEAEEIILIRNNHALESRESKMVIKLNADPTQPEGTYEGVYELRMVPKL